MASDGTSPAVLRELCRSPGAVRIFRHRTVSEGAFRSAARRRRPGAFGVAVLIEDAKGRVLLVRMNPKKAWTRGWVVPGGGGERGETPRAASRREVWEETGVRIRDLALWKVFHEVVHGPRGGSLRWDFLQYVARWHAGVPRSRVPEEISEVRWFSRLPSSTAFRKDWVRARRPPSRSRHEARTPVRPVRITRRDAGSSRGRGRARPRASR
ncbi:MAG: NUDIX hydrolase [Euryarchaeota archaeon]|nr:NUDIX hydrolase [Euryarchaeota archaeon]MDE1837844.1 NUDIX hydrolase [Euryarchaeota archaeon]MDE1880128.1 NUDIX hydrolase [Euryarchaeota archaeon]MDE2046295.1 NUDIX hydrolase [Thermoplasmata archaeon]